MKRFIRVLRVILGVSLIAGAYVLPWKSFHYFVSPSYEKLTGQTLTLVVIAGLLLIICGLYYEKYYNTGRVITMIITMLMIIWILRCTVLNVNNPYAEYNQFESGFYLNVFITTVLIVSLVIEAVFIKKS